MKTQTKNRLKAVYIIYVLALWFSFWGNILYEIGITDLNETTHDYIAVMFLTVTPILIYYAVLLWNKAPKVVTLVKDGKVELDKQGKPKCDGSLGDTERIPLIKINNPEDKIKEIHEKVKNVGIEKFVDFEKIIENLSKWFKKQEEKEILNNEITTLLNESNIDIPKPEKTTEEQIENYRNEGWIPMSESNENEDFSDFRFINGEDWVLPRKP